MNDKQAQGPACRVFSLAEVTSNAKAVMQDIAVSLPQSTDEDGDLLRTCVTFAETFQKWEAFLTDTQAHVTEAQRDEITDSMIGFQVEQLRRISNIQATTLQGHCARAAVILLFDLGVIIERANSGDTIDQCLFAALLVDLATSWQVLPAHTRKTASHSVASKKRVAK